MRFSGQTRTDLLVSCPIVLPGQALFGDVKVQSSVWLFRLDTSSADNGTKCGEPCCLYCSAT